jgi:hypothetical protein
MCRKNAGQYCVRLNRGYSRLQNRSSTLLKEACYSVHHGQSGQSKGLWKGLPTNRGFIARSSNQNSECDHFYGRARFCTGSS